MEGISKLLLDPAESAALRAHGRTDAAVLVPLYDDAERGPVVVLTERRHDLRRHAGEISFPGGRRDEGEELLETALREAEEEIGLPPSVVEVVGALEPTTTLVTSYAVYPFVGVIPANHPWLPQETEVAHVLEIPLRELAAARQWKPLLQYRLPVPTVSFQIGDHLVWGATARIADQLLRRLKPVLDGR